MKSVLFYIVLCVVWGCETTVPLPKIEDDCLMLSTGRLHCINQKLPEDHPDYEYLRDWIAGDKCTSIESASILMKAYNDLGKKYLICKNSPKNCK